ncbi:protein sel-1 homolog 3 [Trichomycterus rosablanca]|uniref:protein sel-1 homolog 3 n=1 Tax=Trichomycterus rosablanca TaxID=2290929 RepID=UPI002F360C7D
MAVSIQCKVTTRTTISPVERNRHGDVLHFDSVPDVVKVNSSARLKYTCTRACRIGIEIVLPNPTVIELVTFTRTRTHLKELGKTRTRTVRISFPPALVYKSSFFFRRPIEAQDVTLRAWMVHLDGQKGGTSQSGVSQYEESLLRTFKVLDLVPILERPTQLPTRSVSWEAELMWNLKKDKIEQCSPESDVVDLLTFPFASTGEKYGVLYSFPSFANKDLEVPRRYAIKKPRAVMSVWLYLLNWCNKRLCGIIKHVDANRRYESPLIMLNDKGNIVVQVCLISGKERAFTVHTILPLHTWIRLDLYFHILKAKIRITQAFPGREMVAATHSFHKAVFYNDTSGYFAIGGDFYTPGIHGYFGPVKYYRLGSEQVVNPLSQLNLMKQLGETHRRCEEMNQITEGYVNAIQISRASTAHDVCDPYYEGLRRTFGRGLCLQTWSWDQQVKYSAALKILRMHEKELISGPWSRGRASLFSKHLFQDVVKSIADSPGLDEGKVDPSLIERLQILSCWGFHKASLMLATLHLSGFGVPVDQEKGQAYSLIGGVADDRLALLHLGYKHMQGLDGFPKNQDVAYGYYANVGQQTSKDSDKVNDTEQTPPEHVDLTSADDMQLQTGESSDVVQFLKHQAERGDIESQKTLARMLFWGTNGVERDINVAMRWYARSALPMTDVSAMYDYAIFLMKGIGLEKNVTLGLKLLQKAADMGSVDALNGLGWYYSTTGDNRKAMHHFELAAANGSRDAMFNLGLYHLSGAALDLPIRNETAAFRCFLKAGEMGHMEGAVEAALYLSKGTSPAPHRDPEKAVRLLKPVSEKNGHLGFTLREALHAYQQGSWNEALLRYAMVAETGLAVAQTNTAHLCEVLKHGSACQWRYHNYSTQNLFPPEMGLLKLGDQYSAVGDMEQAISLYSKAALQGSPQGLYNLAVLIEDGHTVPGDVLEEMQISAEAQQNKSTVVERLLIRCRTFEGKAEELSPCSLALLKLQVTRAWHSFTKSTMQLALTLTTLIIVLTILIQTVLAQYQVTHPASISHHLPGRQNEPDSPNHVRESVSDTAEEAPPVPSRNTSLEQNGQTHIIRPGRSLQEVSDLIITTTGVCVCALCTIFVTHLF